MGGASPLARSLLCHAVALATGGRPGRETGMTSIANAPRVGILIGVLVLTAGRGFACTLDPGDILVTDLGKQAVVEIDTRTGQPCVVSAGGFLTPPTGIAVDAAGQILVVDGEAFDGNGGIIRIDPSSGAQHAVSQDGYFVDPQTHFRQCPNDNLMISCTWNGP